MTHEIMNALAQRRRRLPNRDDSRYSTLKLVVQRMGADSAIVSIIFTNVGGQRLSDTRLGLVRVSTVDETGVQLGPDQMLSRALKALLEQPGR
jgi:hypothetical protein